MEIRTAITYLGERTEPAKGRDDKPWRHHLYNVHLEFEGRSFDFDYRVGTAWHREPEAAWNDKRTFSLPDYLQHGPQGYSPVTHGAAYSRQVRDRFHRERDEKVIAGALASIVSDLELFDEYSDDELAEEYEMRPSQIAKTRAHVAEAKAFLGRHVQEFITTYREE